MPLALLLSPDDQAVSAITAVLEEMAVTCERPLDGGSAAKQLSSQSFDLVLVDCENLPAAKLIFDVCRRGKSGHNPVPIAIVDGRAGLPTAFRLGAELILTKPVAKDQARTTIRNAVSRVKKEEPRSVQAAVTGAAESIAVQPAPGPPAQGGSDPTASLLTQYEVPSEPASGTQAAAPKAAAAAAAAGSSALPSLSQFSAVAPSPVISPETSPTPTPKSKAPIPTPTFEEAPAASIATTAKKSDAPTPPAQPKSATVEKLSDDPVLAGLERGETPPPPIFSTYQPKERKTRGPFVALLVLVIAGGGFYSAWMYVPAFRAAVQPQLEAAYAFADNLLKSRSSASATKPAPPATQPSRAAEAVADASQTSQPADASAAAPTPAGIPAPATASANPGSATAVSAASASSAVQPGPVGGATTPVDVNQPGVQAPGSDTKVATQTIDLSNASTGARKTASASDELPGEKTAVILSSKGAEKRLAHFVRPTFPAGARSAGAEGTVVLKVVIDENGKVAGARVVEGNALLANAAIRAVKQWRYRPYIRDGKALSFQTIVLVDFQRP